MQQRTIQQNKEEWKPLYEYEGLYEVSNLGRVRSVDKITNFKRTGGNHSMSLKGKLLKPINSIHGYQTLGLRKNGKTKQHRVHRLVLSSFIENTDNKEMVNHKDGNRKNNILSNLEWCTRSENMYHAYRELGLTAWSKGKTGKLSASSIPIIQMSLDNKLIKLWDSASDAVRALSKINVSRHGISNCAKGKAKTHKKFKWKYERETKDRITK